MKKTAFKGISLLFVLVLCVSVFGGCKKTEKKTIYTEEYTSGALSDGDGDTSGDAGTDVSGGNTGSGTDGNQSGGANSTGKSGDKATSSTSSKGNSSQQSSQKADPPKNDGVDLKGYKFTIAVIDNGAWMYNGVDKGNGYKQFQQVVADTEKKLNCKIEFKTNYQYGTSFNTFSKTIMSNSKPADIMAIHLYEMCQFTSEKMLIAAEDISGVDLSKSYWNSVVTNSTKIRGKTYGISNDMFSHDMYNNVVFFNKTILDNYKQLENPYDLVKSGAWTYDKMLEMCKAVKDASKGQYGLAINNSDLCVTLPMGGGVPVLQTNGGKVEYVFNNSKAVEVLNKVKEFNKVNDIMVDPAKYLESFAADKALFMLTSPRFARQSKEIANMKSDFGIVPLPKGPYSSGYGGMVDHGALIMTVPSTAKKDLDKIGPIIEELSYQMREKVDEVATKEYADKYFRDDESLKQIQALRKSGTYDLYWLSAYHANIGELTRKVFVPAITEAGKDPKQLLDQYSSVISAAVNTYFNENK